MTDSEGNEYKTIKIGEMEWMAENLKVTQFIDGSPIQRANSKEEWVFNCKNGIPCYCYPDFKKELGEKYGYLYNIPVISKGRENLCPNWGIPYIADWDYLMEQAGGIDDAFNKLIGENSSTGFDGLLGGTITKGGFARHSLENYTSFWTSGTDAYCFILEERKIVFVNALNVAICDGLFIRLVKSN
ncbi:MAG: fibrobacter succinogenes major paralogous domain-containing protein [Crocinitomicaceae bacterium]|nr:fibrobacter succinogenes major paralogous domain-containing protein [Crocinitomicaceae bacterium]